MFFEIQTVVWYWLHWLHVPAGLTSTKRVLIYLNEFVQCVGPIGACNQWWYCCTRRYELKHLLPLYENTWRTMRRIYERTAQGWPEKNRPILAGQKKPKKATWKKPILAGQNWLFSAFFIILTFFVKFHKLLWKNLINSIIKYKLVASLMLFRWKVYNLFCKPWKNIFNSWLISLELFFSFGRLFPNPDQRGM